LSECLKLMLDNQVLALPVVDEDGKFQCVFSLNDLIGIILSEFTEAEIKSLNVWISFFDTFEKHARITELMQKHVKEFELPEAIRVDQDTALSTVINLLIDKKAHRSCG